MSYLDWKVGDRIVCIADPAWIAAGMRAVKGSRYPQYRGVYTIREIRDDAQWGRGEGHIVVLLGEVDNSHFIGCRPTPNTFCYVEPGFPARGFRKVEPRKTDISALEALLHTTRVPSKRKATA